jgi:hypothetical protein
MYFGFNSLFILNPKPSKFDGTNKVQFLAFGDSFSKIKKKQ